MVVFFLGIHHVSDLASLQVPLAHAFLWLLLLHALDTPNRRGLMVLLVASLVLVSLAGVLSISMAIAPWLLIWAFAVAHRAAARLPGRARGAPRLGRPSAPRRPATTFGIPAAILAVGAAHRLRRVHARARRRDRPRPDVPGPAARRHAGPVTRRAGQPVARRRGLGLLRRLRLVVVTCVVRLLRVLQRARHRDPRPARRHAGHARRGRPRPTSGGGRPSTHGTDACGGCRPSSPR